MPHLQTVRKLESSVMFSDLGNLTFQATLILQTVSSCSSMMSYSDVAWENWALAVTSTDSTSAAT